MTKLPLPTDTFARDIAQYRHENRKMLFAHLPRKDWPPLARVCPRSPRRLYFLSPSGQRLKINPFQPAWPMKAKVPAPLRESMLRSEVPRLYSAMAFAMRRYGRVMNAHMTILWKLLGVTDPDKAVEILSKYNKEAAMWLKVGEGDNVVRRRRSRRSSRTSVPHLYVYVHEQAETKGFHTHELMSLPVDRAQAFAEWSRDCLARLAKCASVDEAAVFFTPASKKRRQFNPYQGAREEFAVGRHWRWFRYLTKSLDPLHQERSPVDGAWHVARDIFEIRRPFMATGPVACRRLAGWSENLGQAAQREVGFVSKFELGDWAGRLYDGSELDEYCAFMATSAEVAREEEAQAEVRAMLESMII